MGSGYPKVGANLLCHVLSLCSKTGPDDCTDYRVYYHTQNCSPACNPYLGIAQLATEYKRVKSAALATKHHSSNNL